MSLLPLPARAAWHRPVALGAAAAAGTALLAIGNPDTTHVPLCPLKAITGLDCPFCGSLRAVHSLTRLRVGEALDHNLVFTVAVPFVVVGWLLWLRRTVAGRPAPAPAPRWATTVAVAVLVAFGIARNLPAFAWLGSTA
ncbi:MAG: hypothetical protein JWM89_2085 [Acidimicrobiales bacterium]|nr:hypothetical protein [Acidimicrobiales bacterium]